VNSKGKTCVAPIHLCRLILITLGPAQLVTNLKALRKFQARMFIFSLGVVTTGSWTHTQTHGLKHTWPWRGT